MQELSLTQLLAGGGGEGLCCRAAQRHSSSMHTVLLPPLLLLAWERAGMQCPGLSVCEGVRYFFKYTTETSAGLSLFAK